MTWKSTAFPMPFSCRRRWWFIDAVVQSATVTLPLTSALRSWAKKKMSLFTSRTCSSRRPTLSDRWRPSRWEITRHGNASASAGYPHNTINWFREIFLLNDSNDIPHWWRASPIQRLTIKCTRLIPSWCLWQLNIRVHANELVYYCLWESCCNIGAWITSLITFFFPSAHIIQIFLMVFNDGRLSSVNALKISLIILFSNSLFLNLNIWNRSNYSRNIKFRHLSVFKKTRSIYWIEIYKKWIDFQFSKVWVKEIEIAAQNKRL